MDAVKYFKEKVRMCKTLKRNCNECPLQDLKDWHCNSIQHLFPEKAVEIVEKWSEENPQKSMLQDLLEKYPSVKLGNDGTPVGLCPYRLGYEEIRPCSNKIIKCPTCWNRPLEG